MIRKLTTKVAMIGVGKLGQACAEVMAETYPLVGYDVMPREPRNFRMVDTVQEAVEFADIVFIAAPTPHDPLYDGRQPTAHLPNKDFDYTIVKEILGNVNQYADKSKLVVLISTVLPGTTRRELEPLITNARFVYNPYLIAMGTVGWDFANPEMVMIGTEDGFKTGDARELINFYRPMMNNDPRYVVGTWDECECIKIFYNTFISAKLSLVNMIQDVAERQGNINVDVVTDALKNSTRRIMGPSYMKAGMGDGGACHPRDNIALRYMSENLGLGYDLFDAIMEAREVQARNLAEKLVRTGLENVVIVGKAYKPHVPYEAGSYSLLVGHYVKEFGVNVYYDDEYTGDKPPENLGAAAYLLAHDPETTFLGCLDPDPDKQEKDIFPEGSTIIDPWRKCPPIAGCDVIHYGNTRLNK
jgi:UDPglucose 6-dehydrogenase